ncbi:MAG: LysR substrate-binding domain-containing protein [Steroidobacteraceae bacterium]
MATTIARLPLNSLRVFEAVATRLSFGSAANALNVTPAAVSQQIRALEDYLQVPLFRRQGRRVELTAEGLELVPGVRRGLDELAASVQRMKQHRGTGPLTVSLLASFLQMWLLPRLRSFRRKHPEVAVRFHTSRDPVDFARMPVHAAIRFGHGDYPNLYCEKILGEWVVPVASPEIIRQHGPLTRTSDLAKFPLLDNDDEPWRVWSGATDEEPGWRARASAIDDSAGLLAAAEEGLGYALARWTLVTRALQRRTLRLASEESLPYARSYYFVCPESYLALPKVAQFRDWLREAARDFPSPAEWAKRRS